MKALILSCGGSYEPLSFCIDNYKPDFICFIHSFDSIDVAEHIIKDYNLTPNQYTLKLLEDFESFEESFAKSREVIKELQMQYASIHVDFTGGTKPMVAGLVLAAIGEDCTYSYVGSKNSKGRDKNGMGIVLNGFEKIKEQRDPYDVFAVVEFNRGMDFFNKYQFEAARINFDEASKKLESENLKELSQIYAELVDVYDRWDKFNNKNDNKQTLDIILNNILTKINNSNNVRKHLLNNYPNLIPQIENNIEFLKLKISKKGVIKLENISYYLPDLLNNAERRIIEGKYDDAVARLYRLIELIAQASLAEEGVIDEHILKSHAMFKINKDKIISKNNYAVDRLIQDWYEFNNFKNTFGVGLKKSYQVLDALGSSYAEEYLRDDKILKNLGLRNRSILAHGLQPIDKNDVDELYAQVFKYAKESFSDIEKYIKMAKFPKFLND